MLGKATNLEIFSRAAADADMSIVEGMMGLFDGSSPVNEIGSTAELAKHLAAPVLLVIDGSAMARSAAAMALGYARFDPHLRVAGVLFNRIRSESHYRLLKDAVEAETDLAVVGYLKPDPDVTIPDRHLGLVTAIEQESTDLYERLATAAAETVDLDRIEQIAQSAPAFLSCPPRQVPCIPPRVRIGVAYDPAFCFYYQDNLDALEAEGAEVVRFSPLHDRVLPDVQLLYVGGGYPELYGDRLSKNVAMLQAVRSFAARGGAIYAECGGLMYLTEAIRDGEGRSHDMVGLFPAEAVMSKTAMTLGYREIRLSQHCLLGEAGVTARGHEFHYSRLVPKGPLDHACMLYDARGCAKGPDGFVSGHTLALYTHLHFASRPHVATALIEAAERTSSPPPGIHKETP